MEWRVDTSGFGGIFSGLEQLTYNDVSSSADLAATAELAYLDRSRRPRLMSVTPLVERGNPAFTLAYDELELAREVAVSPEVCLVFSDSRLAYAGWNPLSVTARAVPYEDREGDEFLDLFLEQELRKYPPSRQYLDSLMLRRESWWYTPRLIFRLEDFGEPRPIGRRRGPEDGVLAAASESGLAAMTVAVDDWEAERLSVRPLEGGATTLSGPAALYFHDFSVPDMEQRASCLISGTLADDRLAVRDREGTRELPPRPGLLGRLKGQRRLKKGCAAGLETGF